MYTRTQENVPITPSAQIEALRNVVPNTRDTESLVRAFPHPMDPIVSAYIAGWLPNWRILFFRCLIDRVALCTAIPHNWIRHRTVQISISIQGSILWTAGVKVVLMNPYGCLKYEKVLHAFRILEEASYGLFHKDLLRQPGDGLQKQCAYALHRESCKRGLT